MMCICVMKGILNWKFIVPIAMLANKVAMLLDMRPTYRYIKSSLLNFLLRVRNEKIVEGFHDSGVNYWF